MLVKLGSIGVMFCCRLRELVLSSCIVVMVVRSFVRDVILSIVFFVYWFFLVVKVE